jgi:hypothetical protein
LAASRLARFRRTGVAGLSPLNHRIIDDRLSRGGPAGLVEGVTAFGWFVDTDERLPVHVKFAYWLNF